MSHRRNSGRRKIHFQSPLAPERAFGELVSLDQEDVKQEWLEKRIKLMRGVQSFRERMSQFEGEGDRLFREWLHQSFPALLSHARELESELQEVARMIHAIQFETHWLNLKRWETYRAVLARKKAQEPLISEDAVTRQREHHEKEEQRYRERQEAVLEGRVSENERSRLRDEVQDLLYSRIGPGALFLSEEILDELVRKRFAGESFTFEDIFGRSEEEEEAAYRDSYSSDPRGSNPWTEESAGKPPSSASEDEEMTDLKALYRELVKKLHPDRIGTPNESQKRMWTEVQIAYDRRDSGRLMALRAFVAGEDESFSEENENLLARVIREVLQLKATLKGLKSEERRLSKENAFLYFKKRESEKKLQEFSRFMREQLEQEIHVLRARLFHESRSLESYGREPGQREKKPKNRKDAKKSRQSGGRGQGRGRS